MRRGTPAEGDPLRWAPGIPLRASSPQWRCPCVAGLGGRGRDVRPAAADRGAAAQRRRRAARARRGADLGPVRSADPAALPRPGPGRSGRAAWASTSTTSTSAQVLGYSALILILAEGGLTTRWSGIRDVVAPAAVLSTVGVRRLRRHRRVLRRAAAGPAVAGGAAHRRGSCLDGRRRGVLGAALGRAAPTAVRVAGGRVRVQRRAGDHPDHRLVRAAAPNPEPQHWWAIALLALFELTVGAAIGLAIGWVGAKAVGRIAGASSSLYSLGVIAIAVIAYAVAAGLQRPASSRSTCAGSCRQHAAAAPCRGPGSPRRWARCRRWGCS